MTTNIFLTLALLIYLSTGWPSDNNAFQNLAGSYSNNTDSDTLNVMILEGALYKNNTYKLIDIKNIAKGTRDISVLKNEDLQCAIKLPSQNDYNGLAVNWVRANNKGFEISIEYGSRFYYGKTFYFRYFQNSFYLYKIHTVSFDKAQPKTVQKQTRLLNVNIKDFFIEKYMDD